MCCWITLGWIQSSNMQLLVLILFAECVFLNLNPMAEAKEIKCPEELPIKIGNLCFRFQTYPMTFLHARDSCMILTPGSMMTSYNSQEFLEKLQEFSNKIVSFKLENFGGFWAGISMQDKSQTKAAEDRMWTVDYDQSQFLQKDYKYWDEEGGPMDKGLTCAAVNVTNYWNVAAVDCGGPRLGVVCMMREGKPCHHNFLPYLTYGKHCVANIGRAEYNKIHGACYPNQPIPYQNEDHILSAYLAVKNAFLGGGIFMNMRRHGHIFVDLADGSSPSDDMWEEGEPKDQYDCVVLSLQPDDTLKLKTFGCNFKASSLCFVDPTR